MRLNMKRTALTIVAALLVCGVAVASAQSQPSPRLLPGTHPDAFTTIQGNALNSTNGFLADAPVRLRDVRFGRIVDSTMTDKAGVFTFRHVDPGSYVVELVGKDQTILAASQVVNVDAGAAVSAIVKLPFRIPPFGGLLGHSAASSLAVASAAAASGVLAREVTACKSEPCGS
jgi:hypothetical protein